MTISRLLIANRGEIAIRIARAAAESGLATVAVHPDDDAASLHLRHADAVHRLPGRGARAYLDIEAIVDAALRNGCDGLHPGYGFLSENAELARRCAQEGIRFVGPSVHALALFGDKVQARALAREQGLPLIAGSPGPVTLEEAREFMRGLGSGGAMMIKAVAGGGGRGMRAVFDEAGLDDAYARCRSEAKAAFGSDEVYVERLVRAARHIEVQVVGDATGAATHLWERECTVQRRHQKLIEIAPSPSLGARLRERILEAAVKLARAAHYDNLGTFEFLVDSEAQEDAPDAFAFIEANPRLQVEHTVTEEVLGIDLVRTQLAIAGGATLAGLGLDNSRVGAPRGHAIQLRINMETMGADGSTRPQGGTLGAFDPPTGPGVRVDTFGYAGYRTSAAFDSLLAKLVVHSASPDYADAIARARRALREFRIEGVKTNIGFLEALLAHPAVVANRVTTRFVDEHVAELVAHDEPARRLYFEAAGESAAEDPARTAAPPVPEGAQAVVAPLQGTVVSIDVGPGQAVRAGEPLAILEAMKMEHVVAAPSAGIVRAVVASAGQTLMEGEVLLHVEPTEVGGDALVIDQTVDPSHVRPDLADLLARLGNTLDENRPKAVARRRATGQRTARENIAQLCDEGSFFEYGALAVAAQRARRPLEDLILNTPADGVIAGIGTINAAEFGPQRARAMVVVYDYTVLAGTQGKMNHKKQDRMFELAAKWRLPLVLYAEGGGGRPGDTDRTGLTGLDNTTFSGFARLSGLVPVVGVVSGRCFAGNAALLGCCDVIIATRNASIGMGGPAMIEGGGLGVYHPDEVGPTGVMAPNGVIDVLVEDEIEATDAARKYLSYFQGPVTDWRCADQRLLRHAIPENRLRVYDIRKLIDMLADEDSVLELRRDYGIGVVTAFVRIEGRPFGLIANNPMHLGGAIDAAAGDKASRFMQLCDAHDIPILSLCDTPGFMVGPEAEKTAIVRHVCRMFVIGASLTVPFFTVVLRKGYGLGAQAMAAGGFHDSTFTIAWPTGEFGGMGLEGYVKLGYRKEMEAIENPAQRQAYYESMVAKLYENGKATSIASVLEIDAVIDPERTRQWVLAGLNATPATPPREGRKRPCIDAW
ncbi:MAG: carbamoyl-phosphate synthase large subunit [Burkholderiaceae bacterium]|nr:carbamoyl-phosphate synthase large subunit [Burkholderiaceae bacterium]